MANVYDIISELRREHPTPSASKALDLVVAELGQTRDNLNQALSHLEERSVPAGGRSVLQELAERARAEGVDDDVVPLSPDELRAGAEPVDSSQVGIAVLLGGSALVVVALAAAAVAGGLNGIFHWF
jgi:predicted phage tail protein